MTGRNDTSDGALRKSTADERSSGAVDRYVGQRLRMGRTLAGLTQAKLGHELGITFQQIQKYEKGSNRVSASRLQHMAKVLGLPVSFFFEGSPGGSPTRSNDSENDAAPAIAHFLATNEGRQLAEAFLRIKKRQVRRRIIDLAEAIAGD